MPNQKLSEAEREQLDNLRSQLNEKVMLYGQQSYVVEQVKKQLESEKDAKEEIENELSEAKAKYSEFVQKLYQKYGDVAVDLDTGDVMDAQ
jgi:septal ring factor EnvC (AmiA/AmiB activator)